MHPILLKVGPFTLYTYGVALVVAFTLATWLAAQAAHGLPPRHMAISPAQLVDFCGYSLLGGIIGARCFYVLLHWDWFVSSPQDILAIWHGGLVWYGGFMGALTAGWLYLRAKRLVFLRVMDQCIPFVALGHAVGRIGCFFNGCCYGKPTGSWIGVVFPEQPTALLPTQLFEALGLVFLSIALRRLQPRRCATAFGRGRHSRAAADGGAGCRPHRGGMAGATPPWRGGAPQPAWLRSPGRLFGLYLVSYGVLRFAMEFLRGDQAAFWLGLTLQQCLSIGAGVVGVFLMSAPALKLTNR